MLLLYKTRELEGVKWQQISGEPVSIPIDYKWHRNRIKYFQENFYLLNIQEPTKKRFFKILNGFVTKFNDERRKN